MIGVNCKLLDGNKKTVLITGGFGLLGGRLGQYLCSDYNIILASRFDRNTPDWLPLSKVVKIDWENEKSLVNVCKSADIIIHASGLNSGQCSLNPEKALLVNGAYTKRLVKAAARQGVKRFIYLSTAHVYSGNMHGIVSEHTATTNKHPYATSHVSGEESVLLAASQGLIEGVVVRIANAFGRPVDKDVDCWMLLVNNLCKQAIIEKSLTLQNHSGISRDFVTIDDFCSAIAFLMRDEKADGNVVNIGSGEVLTIGEMTNKVQLVCSKHLGFEPPIINSSISSQEREVFNFKTDYLDAAGFEFINNFTREIEDLIVFCQENFS